MASRHKNDELHLPLSFMLLPFLFSIPTNHDSFIVAKLFCVKCAGCIMLRRAHANNEMAEKIYKTAVKLNRVLVFSLCHSPISRSLFEH
jgi:hypothetical protein